MNYKVIEVTKDNCQEIFDKLYEGSAMTVQGLKMEELDKYIDLFKKNVVYMIIVQFTIIQVKYIMITINLQVKTDTQPN